jgi:hypothetical protein
MESPERESRFYKEKVDTLQRFVDEGYVLHGSPQKIDVLEPHQGHDASGEEHKTMQGVYGTQDIREAIAAALMRRTEDAQNARTYWEPDSENEDTFVFGGDNVELDTGWVYVLPLDAFEAHTGEHDEGEDTEFVAKESVIPHAVVEVDPGIVEHMGNFRTGLS